MNKFTALESLDSQFNETPEDETFTDVDMCELVIAKGDYTEAIEAINETFRIYDTTIKSYDAVCALKTAIEAHGLTADLLAYAYEQQNIFESFDQLSPDVIGESDLYTTTALEELNSTLSSWLKQVIKFFKVIKDLTIKAVKRLTQVLTGNKKQITSELKIIKNAEFDDAAPATVKLKSVPAKDFFRDCDTLNDAMDDQRKLKLPLSPHDPVDTLQKREKEFIKFMSTVKILSHYKDGKYEDDPAHPNVVEGTLESLGYIDKATIIELNKLVLSLNNNFENTLKESGSMLKQIGTAEKILADINKGSDMSEDEINDFRQRLDIIQRIIRKEQAVMHVLSKRVLEYTRIGMTISREGRKCYN